MTAPSVQAVGAALRRAGYFSWRQVTRGWAATKVVGGVLVSASGFIDAESEIAYLRVLGTVLESSWYVEPGTFSLRVLGLDGPGTVCAIDVDAPLLAAAPLLPPAGSVVRLVARRGGETYARVLSATADRVVVDYYGTPLAITSRSPRWRLSPDPWRPELAPLPGEVCPSPTLPAEEVSDVG